MKKYFTIKELQFLDALLNYLAENYKSKQLIPKILFKDKDFVISGSFFDYQNGYSYLTSYDPLNKGYLQKVELVNYRKIGEFFEISAYGEYDQNTLSKLLNPAYFFHKISDQLFEELASKFKENLTPFLYSPVFYNQQMPKLDFYALDEEKTYEVVSILLEEKQN